MLTIETIDDITTIREFATGNVWVFSDNALAVAFIQSWWGFSPVLATNKRTGKLFYDFTGGGY